VVGFIGVVLGIFVSLQTLGWLPGSGHPSIPAPPPDSSVSAEITLSRSTAPRGTQLTVFGSGFQPGEQVEIRVHVDTVGSATADSHGKFTQTVVVPQSAPPPGFPTSVSATGHSSIRTATAPFSTS
jgi:hypothetical protein